MMDEKKLMKEIKDAINDGRFDGYKPAAVLFGICDMIREMPKDDGWIPCSEGMPEDDKYILLSFENFPVPVVGRYEADSGGGAFYAGDDDESCTKHDVFVNAWMPLPEPWKRGSETWAENQNTL